ncbi:MAG: ORF6N domain-containing protein [Candidatus Moranbacteria bacterium]|nr:ORF6N domain-containing protein [Candidatus Moranbacteria bacterium]MBP6034101.1 ORF6N domain-containing protein [Candidatus Moranbacteria bacterium]MBP7695853.1 ORF6N domain-containing protein [Candidatus Moranbacteria bacterium]
MPEKAAKNLVAIPNERIEKRIFWLRGEKVMLDADLAELYDVLTGNLNKAVKRNIDRFPSDFMFQLNKAEFDGLMFQNGISKGRGGKRKLPYAFTEQGVAMLSSVLKSQRAVAVNIQIVRTFVELRKMLATHEGLRKKIEAMERKYDKQFKAVFDVLRQLLKEETEPKQKIGFAIKQ